MAVSPFKTFSVGEILTASDLNSSFTQITTNGEDLAWPATKAKDLNGQALILDADADSQLVEISDDVIGLQLTGVAQIIKFDGAAAGAALANGLTLQPAETTVGPSILAHGTDTNIDINITPKGSGVVTISNLTINIVDDTSPQLGAQLDVNGFALGSGTLELLDFTETASAVNHINITNNITTAAPRIGAAGDDANIDLALVAKGTGDLTILDPADLTSVMKVDPSAIATATTRTLTMPDADVNLGNLLANVVEDTTPELGGNLACADNQVQRPEFIDYSEEVVAVGGSGGGTQDFDLTTGNVHTVTVDTSANTFTFSNPPASGKAGSLTLIVTNGGSQTVNWPASVDWAGASAPTLTTSGVDILTFLTVDGGTIWHGFAASLDSS